MGHPIISYGGPEGHAMQQSPLDNSDVSMDDADVKKNNIDAKMINWLSVLKPFKNRKYFCKTIDYSLLL